MCKRDGDYFIGETCVFYDNSHYTPYYYIQECSDINNPYCDFKTEQNSTCTKTPAVSPTYKYPGEKCLKDSDCLSYNCNNQRCLGQQQSESCDINLDCEPGLYCKSLKCTPLITLSTSSCSSDYECNYGTGCLTTCIPYWSLSSGSATKCDENNESFLCSSGKCYNGKCVTSTKSDFLPKICIKDLDCSSKNIENECECGRNPNGNKFCKLKSEDWPYSGYFEIMKEWTMSDFQYKCNTERRFSIECAADRWNRGKAEKLQSYIYYIRNYAKIVEFDTCSHSIFIPDYILESNLEFSSANVLFLYTLSILFY
ncbi:hypothetical protein SteCoe_4562 [Stentor coeruleus]|uniref:Dickkopf N-terminal cysteine-rich domain-containing protein n=1 Tax=Stentor coeruleus TaxID=5963 RepID=A0A1R2CUL4_9CILI|nr:hypothetical protein SteCoe_4562 [Stentor coeruleus]